MINTYDTKNVKVVGIAPEGIKLKILIDNDIDILDFIDEIGWYFYKIDDPTFGQAFITNETKEYIYYWLIELFNTGNYTEKKYNPTILEINLLVNFESISPFKYAIKKYETYLKAFKDSGDSKHKILACQIAIDMLTIVQQIIS